MKRNLPFDAQLSIAAYNLICTPLFSSSSKALIDYNISLTINYCNSMWTIDKNYADYFELDVILRDQKKIVSETLPTLSELLISTETVANTVRVSEAIVSYLLALFSSSDLVFYSEIFQNFLNVPKSLFDAVQRSYLSGESLEKERARLM